MPCPVQFHPVTGRADRRSNGTTWTVSTQAAGTRLDKFLAAGERLGSRGRVIDALDKGKVFLNEDEATSRQAGAVLRAGDVVRVWMDRPGSA